MSKHCGSYIHIERTAPLVKKQDRRSYRSLPTAQPVQLKASHHQPHVRASQHAAHCRGHTKCSFLVTRPTPQPASFALKKLEDFGGGAVPVFTTQCCEITLCSLCLEQTHTFTSCMGKYRREQKMAYGKGNNRSYKFVFYYKVELLCANDNPFDF